MLPNKPDDHTEQPQEESYIHDPGGAFTKRFMAERTAANSAAFFLPHLRSGQTLLDMGCGLGTITLGLAEAVSPGEVVGIDKEESQTSAARDRAKEQGVSNVRFTVGNAYQLDFESDSFDVVFSNALLEHLKRPVDALKEAWRVLRPGGIVGIRSADFGSMLWGPEEPLLEEHTTLSIRYRQHNGGDPFIGRKLRALLREAGFENTQFSSSCGGGLEVGTTKSTKAYVEASISEWAGPRIREVAIRLGWADNAYFDRVEQAFRTWSESPDSFFALIRGEAIGWKT